MYDTTGATKMIADKGILPLRVTVDRRELKDPGVISGRRLFAELTDRSKWSKENQEYTSVGFYLFAMPFSNALGVTHLERQLRKLNGKMVLLGGFPSLRTANTSTLDVELQPDMVYDIFLVGKKGNGETSVLANGRVTTKQTDHVPYGTTLEEARLLALLGLGIGVDEVNGLKTRVAAYTAWGSMPGRIVIAGFHFPQSTGIQPRIEIQHDAIIVPSFGGHSVAEVKEALLRH